MKKPFRGIAPKRLFLEEKSHEVRNHFSAFYRAIQQQQQHIMVQQNWLIWMEKCVIEIFDVEAKIGGHLF